MPQGAEPAAQALTGIEPPPFGSRDNAQPTEPHWARKTVCPGVYWKNSWVLLGVGLTVSLKLSLFLLQGMLEITIMDKATQ